MTSPVYPEEGLKMASVAKSAGADLRSSAPESGRKSEAEAFVREALDYAYRYGLHEIGYDPVAVLTSPLPLADDVVRLVVAAREVAFTDIDDEKLRELDQASEAFAERVPWDDEPADPDLVQP